MMLRRLAELAARYIVMKRSIRIGKHSLKIFVTPDAQLKYAGKVFDSEILDWCVKNVHKGDVVFDVGANCGVFGFASILRGARFVYFFEPDLRLAALIGKTIEVNNLMERCCVVPAALSDRTGTTQFNIAKRGRASNSIAGLGRTQQGGVRATINVPSVTLDAFLDQTISDAVFKIDVEGAELNVLLGASKLGLQSQLKILIETEEKTHKRVDQILSGFGCKKNEVFPDNFEFFKERL